MSTTPKEMGNGCYAVGGSFGRYYTFDFGSGPPDVSTPLVEGSHIYPQRR